MTKAASGLVADDRASTLAVVRATLGRAYRLLEAHDGVEALALARAEQPDVALVRSDLPLLDGFMLCRQLKADPQTRHIATLILMDTAGSAEEQRGSEGEADGYLTEPLSPVALLAAVDHVVTKGWAPHPQVPPASALAEELRESPPELEQTLSYARELGALYGEWKAQVDTIEHRLLHDSLTDLPNRALLRRRIEEAIDERSADAGSLALLLMDLDRFKQINDTLGHHNGDLLLQEVAARLSRLGRGERTTARLGGDEFAVLLPTRNSTSATLVAQEILGAVREPFLLEGLPVEVEASIGIALYPEHGEDADTLLRRADVAMYLAKAAESGCRLYVPEDDPHSPSRLALAAELRRAIETEELLLHYLPRVNCRTSRIDAVEALVRWEHPRHGLMGPDQFIPLAESTGLIRPLTLRVLDGALRQCRAWRKARMNLGMAVNLSARDFQDSNLAHRIAGLLATCQVEPARLTLEVTERVVMVDELRVRESMAGLREIGVRFAIDDFGTGYSSLARLKDLPVDELKIDKSFVTDMASHAKDAAIVRSSIELGHNLGLQVVAEGVESRDTWNLLVTLGCDAAQGYYLSRPIPAAQLTRGRTRAPVGVRG